MKPLESPENATEQLETRPLRFVWWNTQDFAHYVPGKSRLRRWPDSDQEYRAKCARIDQALRAVENDAGPLDVVALGEITRIAAQDLQNRLYPTYNPLSLDNVPDPDLHVAILYRREIAFEAVGPFAVANVPPTTRPMAVLDFVQPGHRVRFIVAHWTSPFDETSILYQEMVATQLKAYIYDYLGPRALAGSRHVVLMGDLNTEPFQITHSHLLATRSRERARTSHYSDEAVKRVRLYNCSWRLLGEQEAHAAERTSRDVAGTYYWADKKTWHTVDQVLVTGGLLSRQPPYLAEASIRVFIDENLVDGLGHPRKFEWNGGAAIGVSDHLPLLGELMIQEEKVKHE